MTRNLYKLTHKEDGGSCPYTVSYKAYRFALQFDNGAILLNDEPRDGVNEYLFCTEEAYDSIKHAIGCDMVEQ